MHEAVASGRRELVKWLLDGRPSQVNATNHEGRTPLHIAAATDNADLCRLLLDRGAEVNPVARSSKNEPLTPLDCATTRGHRSTAKYLQMHGGMPASKLSNTQIVIDGAPITALPTRRVTSTKIDVRDRIRIEKREVVELSSPVADRRRIKERSESESSDSSSSIDKKKSKRRSEHKYSDRHHGRRKKLLESQKSFSDGYDSEIDGYGKEVYSHKKKRSPRKSRSKSEPSRGREYVKHRRNRSGTENSSGTDSCSEKRKHKRHRKRSKRRSSSSETSSSESSERRSTKRKGKKTSIHIEHDDEKQSVNIVKYKNMEAGLEKRDITPIPAEKDAADEKSGPPKDDSQALKSETETDTVSVKTNMVVTEAQIHMERESSQHGSSELTVTVDSSNNVSIETSNLSVTHKDLNDEKSLTEGKLDESIEAKEPVVETAEVTTEQAQLDGETKSATLVEEDSKKEQDSKKEEISQKQEETPLDTKESLSQEQDPNSISSSKEGESDLKTEQVQKESQDSSKHTEPTPLTENDGKSDTMSTSTSERVRKRSFQVLSGPDEALMQSKEMSGEFKTSLDAPSIDQTESQEKSSSPVVSFANKDEIFESKESDKQPDHLMGEYVDHSDGLDNLAPGETQKDSSERSIVSSEDKRKEYASTTGSSTEISQSVDKGLVTVIDGEFPPAERAVQQVIMENGSEEYDINLPLSESPKRTRKSSRDSQISSRKNSIYETESYKVLSDIASAPEVTTGILKKSSKIEDGSLEDDKDTFERDTTRDGSFGRVPSVSDNEIYSQSEANGRRKRFRKKGRTKSRTTIRSKSENSERGYESSGLMDSGFEPSPRALQRRIMSPRLAAYYQQRNASGRYSGKSDSRIPVRKPGDKRAVDMKSVTQRIQTNMRR